MCVCVCVCACVCVCVCVWGGGGRDETLHRVPGGRVSVVLPHKEPTPHTCGGFPRIDAARLTKLHSPAKFSIMSSASSSTKTWAEWGRGR